MDKTPLPEPTLREWILWILRLRARRRVLGRSMLPTLEPSDLVLVDRRAYSRCMPTVGDVVVARHPSQEDVTLIKRVGSVEPDGTIYLLSDNPREGTDSRTFGAIDAASILGRVTSCVRT